MIKGIIVNPKIFKSFFPEDWELFIKNVKKGNYYIFLFSTKLTMLSKDVKSILLQERINVDLVTSKEVGENKGSPEWIRYIENKWGIKPHNLVYIGVNNLDWRTSINSGVFHCHAAWAEEKPLWGMFTFRFNNTTELFEFIEIFLKGEGLWGFKYDNGNEGIHFRSLFPADIELPKVNEEETFNLKDIFTYNKEVVLGSGVKAIDVLTVLLLIQLWKDGLISSFSYFLPYPSSKKDKKDTIFIESLDKYAKLFHGYYMNDILIRYEDTIDKSLTRYEYKEESSRYIKFENELNTLKLDEKIRNRISNKTFIVIDDFSTTGMSLETARNLLKTGGAKEIVLCSVGKYRKPYTIYSVVTDFDPYSDKEKISSKDYEAKDFIRIDEDNISVNMLKILFKKLGLDFIHKIN